jgi:hypothetical protein
MTSKTCSPKADVVLLQCVKEKRPPPCTVPAEQMYTSVLFKKMMEYAHKLSPRVIFILSAKYGLLPLDTMIEPYNETLNEMPKAEREKWATKVLDSLRRSVDLENDHIVVLAGKRYREGLISDIRNFSIPMEGLSIGRQLRWLKEQLQCKGKVR